MSIPLPDHTTAAGAGPGQPIHTEVLGQTFWPNPNAPGGIAVDTSSLHPGSYLKVLTLDRIYRLLVMTIASMQKIAVTQANRLRILSDWQNAYNAALTGVHIFIANNGDNFISATGGTESTARQDLNTVTSNYIESIRSNNSIVADNAKALQTVINQTQDAVSQQSNMATSIIQQFATILSSIYR